MYHRIVMHFTANWWPNKNGSTTHSHFLLGILSLGNAALQYDFAFGDLGVTTIYLISQLKFFIWHISRDMQLGSSYSTVNKKKILKENKQQFPLGK